MSTLAAPRFQRPLSRFRGHDIAIVLCIYAITRAISAAFILVAGRFQEGTAQFASNDPWNYYVWQPQPPNPGYVDVLSNWDGQWYLRIANLGYLPSSDDPFGFADRAWAFPPLFPLAVTAVSDAVGISTALAAVLVSTIAGAGAMVLLFRMTEPLLGRFGSLALVAVIGCYITAPLYQAAYTESLAMFFLMWTLLDMRDRRYARMFLPMLLLVFTRLITPPLAIVAAAHLLVRQRTTTPASAREITLLAGYGFVSVAGIGLWPWIASRWSGSADADRARVMLSAEHLGWFDILWSIEPWTVAVPVILAAWFIRLAVSDRGRLGPELAAWAAVYPMFILVVTPPTPGFFRYFMLAFPLSVGAVGSRDAPLRRRLVAVAAVCVVMLVLQYLWVRFSFVVDPDPGEPLLNP